MTNAQLTLIIRSQNETSAELKRLRSDLAGLEQPAKKASNSLSGLQNIVKAGIALKGVQETIGFLSSATKAAAEDAASVKQLQIAVQNTGVAYASYAGQIDKAISQGQKLAFSDDQTRESLSLLAAETGSASEALRRYSIAQDLARGTGMDVVAASRLLGKVTDENTRVLARYGIVVRKGASETELLASVQERFGGQAAAFADTAAGRMARFNDRLSEAKEAIGNALIPVLDDALIAANAFFDGLNKIGNAINSVIGRSGVKTFKDLEAAEAALAKTTNSLEREALTELINQLKAIPVKPVEDVGNAFDRTSEKAKNLNRDLTSTANALAGFAQVKTPEQLKLESQIASINAEIAKQKILLDEAQRTGRTYSVVTAESAQKVRDANIDVAQSYTRLQEAQSKYNEVSKRTKDGDLEFQKAGTDLISARNEYNKSLAARNEAERTAVTIHNADAEAIKKNLDTLDQAKGVFDNQLASLNANRDAAIKLAEARKGLEDSANGIVTSEAGLLTAIQQEGQQYIDAAKAAGELLRARQALGVTASSPTPAFPGLPGGAIGRNLPGQARGTSNFPGGWTWVGEQGAELMRLPRGTQVMSHPNSMRYARSAKRLAAGNYVDSFSGGRQTVVNRNYGGSGNFINNGTIIINTSANNFAGAFARI